MNGRGLLIGLLALTLLAGGAMADTVIINGVATDSPTQLPAVSQPAKDRPAGELDEEFIDFDDLDAPPYFSDAFPLTNEYAGQGVIFSGQGEVLHEDGNFGISGYSSPNFLAFNTGAGVSGPETLTFDPPVDMVSIWAAHNSSGTIMMEAFDTDGVLVNDAVVFGTSTMQELLITGDVEIGHVVLSFTGTVCCFDDLTFDPDTTPPPVVFDLIPTTTVLPPSGGDLVYDVQLTSNLDATYPNVQYWTTVILPNGQEFGPLVTVPFTMTPFMDVYVTGLTQTVPALAPSGSYTFIGHVGYQSGPMLQDSFEFEKTGTATDGAEGWKGTFPYDQVSQR